MAAQQRSHPTPGEPPVRAILVWDLPTRLFHWLLACSVLGAYAASDSERWIALHAMLGYTAGGLVAFRVLWGVAGTRYARFSGFAWAPRSVVRYMRSLLAFEPQHYVGHNPAGSWAIAVLLVLVALTAASGYANLNQVGPAWIEDVHEGLANATLALAALHVVAVVISSLLHRENLVRSMFTGTKRADAMAAAGTRWPVGLALIAAVAAFWLGYIPAPGLQRGTGVSALPTPSVTVVKERQRDRRQRDDD